MKTPDGRAFLGWDTQCSGLRTDLALAGAAWRASGAWGRERRGVRPSAMSAQQVRKERTPEHRGSMSNRAEVGQRGDPGGRLLTDSGGKA